MAGRSARGLVLVWSLAVHLTLRAEARAESSDHCLLQHRSVLGIASKGAATEDAALLSHLPVRSHTTEKLSFSVPAAAAPQRHSLASALSFLGLSDVAHRTAAVLQDIARSISVEAGPAQNLTVSLPLRPTKQPIGQPMQQVNRSKIILLMFEISTCGIFGLDRMYMGQWHVGLMKLLGGAFLVYCLVHNRALHRAGRCLDNIVVIAAVLLMWDLTDYLVVLDSCLFKRTHLHVLGFHAQFTEDSSGEETAFLLASIHVLSLLVACVIWCCWSLDASPESRGSIARSNARAAMEAMNHSREAMCSADLKEACPICLEKIADGQQMQTLPCFHIMHHTCAALHFKKTARRKAFCPVCRNEVGPAAVLGPAAPDES